MVGIYGEINPSEQSYDLSPGNLAWLGSEDIFKFSDKYLKICSATHDVKEEDMPAETRDGEALIWVCGEIVGFDDGKKYRSKQRIHPGLTDSEYCASLYDRYGIDFVKGLNSNFAGVIYDRKKNFIAIFTDRLSARPIFYTRDHEGALIFSTSLQKLAINSQVEHQFDEYGLCDFITTGRPYGLRTVIKGVKQLHPATLLIYGLDSKNIRRKVYWQPRYEPQELSLNDLNEKFYKIFKKSVCERQKKEKDNGLMLSGGSDSRLIAGILEKDAVCFHLNETMDEEAKTAQKIAISQDQKFRFLKKGNEYYPKVLEISAEISNMISWFHRAHPAGFTKELRKESDFLFVGQYADTILGERIIKTKLKIPFLGGIQLPIQKNFKNVEEFEKRGKMSHNDSPPNYLSKKMARSYTSSLDVKNKNKRINFHGVVHHSMSDFLVGPWYYYPLTNTFSYLMYYMLTQTNPVRYPYLDNNVIDFALKIPTKHLLRKDIVNNILSNHHKDLAKIPHPSTGLPLTSSRWKHLTFKNLRDLFQKMSPSETHRWGMADYAEIIRETDFVEKKLQEHSDILDECEFISKKQVWKIYQKHMKGENHVYQLHPLLTFLENPITKNIIRTNC